MTYTAEQAAGLPLVGSFKNMWRQRFVRIHQHPDPALLVTVGTPFDGGQPIVTVEPRENYEKQVGKYGVTVE